MQRGHRICGVKSCTSARRCDFFAAANDAFTASVQPESTGKRFAMKIAFLGLGNMGSHMARHLLHAGHDVTVWNRTPSKADGLRAQGAKIGKSAGETVKDAEAVITMLADDHAVESAALHSGGVLDHLPSGAVHISMSTISVALSQKLAEEHGKRGQQYIAAPVFGRPEAAEAGKL